MVIQCLGTGDYGDAVRSGREALSIAHSVGDRSIEVVATTFLGMTHAVRGEFREASTLLERNVALEGELRYERFGAPAIQAGLAGALLAEVLSERGQFDEAIGQAEAAVGIGETADHPFTLYWGLFGLGLVLFRRGDFPRATSVLERCLELCRTWQLDAALSPTSAILAATYSLAGRVDEALELMAGAIERIRTGQIQRWKALSLLCFGTTCLSAGRIDEAASHAREALLFTRRVGDRGSEVYALCLAGDVESTRGSGEAEGCYREALRLGQDLGMPPAVAHCHRGLGRLCRGTGRRQEAREHLTAAVVAYREMGMPYWLDQTEAEMRELG